MATGRNSLLKLLAIAALGGPFAAHGLSGSAAAVDFSRDVRPILADACFHCHGPDAEDRHADLRLDAWESGLEFRAAEEVILPGDPQASELVARITSDDESLRMPPADSGKSLTPDQIETLRRWIAQGAEYKKHWAFVPPQRPDIPSVDNSGWVQNPIDAFVLARLEREGLEPSPPADRRTLMRRLSLDLIGLPPTVEQLQSLDAVDGPAALQQHIERLLSSPHFGERWGRLWLDAARYADSDGFEKDKPRSVWMYRDWVIAALNDDLPYDEFLIEQLAGDLLPEVNQDRLVATGFLRNSMINEEGGIDPEEFRMEAMFDRMDAVGKAILGLTVQCAQCHTHKYDPLTHTEYYQMFAFLNNCYEAQIPVYTPEEQQQWHATHGLIQQMEHSLRDAHPDWPQQMAAWEKTVARDDTDWEIVHVRPADESGQKYYLQPDGSVLSSGYGPTKLTSVFTAEIDGPTIAAIRLELLTDANLPRGGPGRSPYGTCALSQIQVEAAPLDRPEERTRLKLVKATADVNPPRRELDPLFDDRRNQRREVGPVELAIDDDSLTAWTVEIGPGRSNVPRQAVFVLEEPLPTEGGMRLTFRLVQNHGGWNNNDNQTNNLGRFRFAVTEQPDAEADPLPGDVRQILKLPADQRSAQQIDRVFSYWRTTVPEWHEQNRRIEALWQSHPRGTTQLILLERSEPRLTHRLERGDFLAPAETVSPGVPAFLHPMEDVARGSPDDVVRGSPDPALAATTGLPLTAIGRTSVSSVARSGDGARAKTYGGHATTEGVPDRLAFARWLADRRSPTTARAVVNRLWQAYFGTGLVATAEDLGIQGEAPSHLELLDWLAVELMDRNWSLKHIHRLIVTSATYRQSSAVTPELHASDPDNRLLARGPRYRVDAELVRDIALSASGLLNPKVGGPSVHPPAPDFLFRPPASYGTKTWHVATGPDRYRRAMYTFRFRSVPYPALQNFDAPTGEISCVRRTQSNTPLQALTTLNEPLFVECARALALRIVAEGGPTDVEKIAYAVRSCLSREPDDDETAVLQEFLAAQQQRFQQPEANPWPLLAVPRGQRQQFHAELPDGTTPGQLAAWTALARVVLNLDETITKE